jgi:ElaB/YqjD/DUF883 family membrane-anchored ribosome-binding protein
MSTSEDITGHNAEEAKSPEELRREIAKTREELGDTVEALAEKAGVKAQAKQRAAAAKQAALEKKQELMAKAKATTPETAGAGAQQLATTAKENPLPLAAGGAFLLGYMLGRRRGR